MSITLVTGVPGSGKTLYAIAKLIRPMLAQSVTRKLENGQEEKIPRVLYTNINGFQLEHELIDAPGIWVMKDRAWVHDPDPKNPLQVLHNQGLHHWQDWAKPGALIVYDEFQKAWPPRPNGAPVPPDIQALDTHRHMGVDFILPTQNCNNVDRHILGLVDRHIHMRRVGNMALAVVYEWDHASRSLLYRNSVSKSPWRYDKSVYKLYKSAEVHTVQNRKLPGLVWFILVGLAGFAYLGPTTFSRISDRAQGKTPGVSAKTMQPMTPAQLVQAPAPGQFPVAPSALAGAPAAENLLQKISGCIASPTKCTCFDDKGRKVDQDAEMCTDLVEARPSPVDLLPDTPRLAVADPDDLDVREFMHKARRQ